MSVEKRLEAMGDETELNLDGINKPDLTKISAECAKNLTGRSIFDFDDLLRTDNVIHSIVDNSPHVKLCTSLLLSNKAYSQFRFA